MLPWLLLFMMDISTELGLGYTILGRPRLEVKYLGFYDKVKGNRK